jgi:transposase-like protein
MRKRKTYTPAQKLRAALDLIKGDRSAVDIARDVGCHPTIIVDWKNALEKSGTLVFEHQADETKKDAKIAKLERMIGKLSMQNDFLEQLCDRSS